MRRVAQGVPDVLVGPLARRHQPLLRTAQQQRLAEPRQRHVELVVLGISRRSCPAGAPLQQAQQWSSHHAFKVQLPRCPLQLMPGLGGGEYLLRVVIM